MGIESDQLVYDYLSRVGDLAQQRQLPSGTRMRLVAGLRDQIDRSRAKTVVDSPVAIRRILAGLGTPEDVVDAAGDAPGDVSAAQPSAPPAPRTPVPTQRGSRPRRIVPRPRRTPKPPPRQDPMDMGMDGPRPSPPHLAGSDELGPSGSEPDWWRVDSSPFGVADSVPGFVGGVEIPEILKPPPSPDDPSRTLPRPSRGPEGTEEGVKTAKTAKTAAADEVDAADEAVEDVVEDAAAPAEGRRRWRPRLRGSDGAGLRNPLLLLAAALLTIGAVLGNWLALGGGWLIAYASRRLSRAEAKWAAMGMPGLAVAAGFTWLWGRTERHWGERITEGHMSDAMAETWPWVVRGAAVASALFLVWRSQRRRP
ncbi:hypothetical protein [Streptomyces sp. NPDC003006]